PRPRRRPKPKKSGGKAVVIVSASVAAVIVVAVLAAIFIPQIIKSRRSDPRLFGTWKSDADATIAEMKTTRTFTDDQEQKLKTLFGKMKITYMADTLTTDFDGRVESQS